MKSELYKKAIAWAEKRGFTDIKANIDDFETPVPISRSGEGEAIMPDITGVAQGRKNYIEIAMKEDDKRTMVSKWKLFCTLTSMKGGKVYLLAGRGNKAYVTRVVEDYNLNATIISI